MHEGCWEVWHPPLNLPLLHEDWCDNLTYKHTRIYSTHHTLGVRCNIVGLTVSAVSKRCHDNHTYTGAHVHTKIYLQHGDWADKKQASWSFVLIKSGASPLCGWPGPVCAINPQLCQLASIDTKTHTMHSSVYSLSVHFKICRCVQFGQRRVNSVMFLRHWHNGKHGYQECFVFNW